MRIIVKLAISFFTVCLLSFAANTISASEPDGSDHPNVIVFLSDDQGWGDLGSSGNGDLSTPNIDSLAKAGARFDRFYVCPVCSPTRAEFLTGRHHARSGVYSTSAGGERMNLDETTIADLFRASGYATGAFGKWHNGMQYPYHPNGRGFDEYYGFCSGHWGNYFDPMLEHNGRIVEGDGFCVDDFTSKAISFMQSAVEKEKPFFAYLPYNTPHSPMQVPDTYWERFENKALEFVNERMGENPRNDTHKRCALAMCENLDWNVGRVLEKLEEWNIDDNTIVVWFHDNGPNGNRWNGGMKGRKGSTDEGGVRSPLYIRWPAKIEAGTEIAEITSARDLLPTLCAIANVPVETRYPVDGRSLEPLLLGEESEWPDRVLINHWRDKISARSQRFRLDNNGKLFDMQADPGQHTEVNDAHPEVLSELTKIVQSHRDQFMANYSTDDRPFVLAHPDSNVTQLPARDAVAHGNIERSNRFPNCSYFGNWISTDDRITFAGQVEAAGKYEVTLYYACKEAGSKFELSFKDAVLPFELETVHDVAELGAEHDRHPRSESYVKKFRPLSIGVIELKEGEGELELRAIEIAGEEAMEFRLILLERVE